MNKLKPNRNESFKSTIGFDFIFYKEGGHKIPLCIELNGHDSGLKAVETISAENLDQDERARVNRRMTHTKERIELSAYAESLDELTQTEARKEAWAKAKSVPGFIHAFQNPSYIQEICKNKKLQQKFIPAINRPRIYEIGDSLISRTGFWICKPIMGRKGRGIQILSNENFENSFIKNELNDTYIAQEFIQASGADKATPDIKDNPASMRLLIDFIYLENGEIDEVFSFAYQRVSPFSINKKTSHTSLEDVYVVNFARGAKAVVASEAEYNLAHKVALEIIQNIAKDYIESTKNS